VEGMKGEGRRIVSGKCGMSTGLSEGVQTDLTEKGKEDVFYGGKKFYR